MTNSIEKIFRQYQAKFPMYTREAVINEMVKDGVFEKMLKQGEIKQADIELLKKGGSLFLSGNIARANLEFDMNPTEIFGGHFSKTDKSSSEKPIIQPHKFTSLVDVNAKGEIFTSQFTYEGIRKKFDEKKYKVTKVIDKEYPNFSTITVTDRKKNKKVCRYEIYDSSKSWSTKNIDINISNYDIDGKKVNEFVMVSEYGSDCYIGKVSKDISDKEAIDIFYERNGNIRKTYEYSEQIQNGKKVMDMDKITLYSNGKPYKVLEGDYKKTISNYTVDELANILENKKSLNYEEQMQLSSLINTITKKNVFEMVFDYQTKTGRDLLDDIQKIADNDKSRFGESFYVQSSAGKMIKHIRECMTYEGGLSNDSWLNDHSEEYVTNRLIKDLEHGRTDLFKEDLKLAGINLDKEEKADIIEIFGNLMVDKVIKKFQHKADSLYKDSTEDKNLTKGILYTIAKSDSIKPKEKADIILDTMTQLGYIHDDDIRKEIADFAKSNEFMNLMTRYCTEGKYSKDILADMELNKNNPDKILVDFKRLKARNTERKENTAVSKPNGKIDIDFKQGNTGDCWLLAGVISLCKKANGKAKLESLIKVNEKTGDVTVTLKGVNKKYTISYDEIKNSNHLSGGDGDMRALELAFDKYIRELAYDKKVMANQVDIQGNTTYYLYQILFGDGKDFGKYKPEMNKDFNDPNKSFCIGAGMFDASPAETVDAMLDSKGKRINFVTGHAYAVVKTDSKYVYLVNPWDSKETLKIEHERLEKLRVNVGECIY